jgi:hypothetical protein
MSIQGAGGLGPVGIPENYHPTPGDDFKQWSTESIKKSGDDFVLKGEVGVGVLENGTVTIDAAGKASVKAPMYAAGGRPLDHAELSVFKQKLEDEVAAGGKNAKLIQAALDRLGGATPPSPNAALFANARYGDIKRDVKGGIQLSFGFGVDQAGTVYATKGGSLSFETHVVPMKPGTPQPMTKADREAFAAAIRPLALTMTPPNPLFGDLLNDATKK